jgi:hypothetical protein
LGIKGSAALLLHFIFLPICFIIFRARSLSTYIMTITGGGLDIDSDDISSTNTHELLDAIARLPVVVPPAVVPPSVHFAARRTAFTN